MGVWEDSKINNVILVCSLIKTIVNQGPDAFKNKEGNKCYIGILRVKMLHGLKLCLKSISSHSESFWGKKFMWKISHRGGGQMQCNKCYIFWRSPLFILFKIKIILDVLPALVIIFFKLITRFFTPPEGNHSQLNYRVTIKERYKYYFTESPINLLMPVVNLSTTLFLYF